MNLEMCVTGNDCYGSGTRAILYPCCQGCEAMPTTKRVPKLLSCNWVNYLKFEKFCIVSEARNLWGLTMLNAELHGSELCATFFYLSNQYSWQKSAWGHKGDLCELQSLHPLHSTEELCLRLIHLLWLWGFFAFQGLDKLNSKSLHNALLNPTFSPRTD